MKHTTENSIRWERSIAMTPAICPACTATGTLAAFAEHTCGKYPPSLFESTQKLDQFVDSIYSARKPGLTQFTDRELLEELLRRQKEK